jgi:hypothetical protein
MQDAGSQADELPPMQRCSAQTEMGASIAASPHCAERRICRCSYPGLLSPEGVRGPGFDPGSPAQASRPVRLRSPKRSLSVYLPALPEGPLVFRSSGRSEDQAFEVSRPFLG